MSDSSRLDPDKAFPEDLTTIDRDDLDILNSRNHRSRDLQYIRDGDVDPETEGQHHELREELDRRQALRDNTARIPVKGTSRPGDLDEESQAQDA